MSKCRRQAIFYNLSDFNCFKHVRARCTHGIVLLPLYPSLFSRSAPLSFLVSLCVWRILFVALSTCFHIERCHLPDLVDDPASSCYSLLPCFPLLLLLASSFPPLVHVPRLSHVCCLPPSPSLSVYLASAASFYELCRALMLITL